MKRLFIVLIFSLLLTWNGYSKSNGEINIRPVNNIVEIDLTTNQYSENNLNQKKVEVVYIALLDESGEVYAICRGNMSTTEDGVVYIVLEKCWLV